MTTTKMKVAGLALVLLGIAALFIRQEQQNKRWMAEASGLREQDEQAALLRDENQRLAAQLKAAVEGSQADRSELVRLRGQAVKLRQVEQENAQLRTEGQRLAGQAVQAGAAVAPSEQQPTAIATTVKAGALFTSPNTTDLGMLELSDGIAARFDLGGGTNCVVTPTALSDGNAIMEITVGITNADGTVSELDRSRITARPGQHCAISVGDRMIGLAVKLKTQ